MSTPTPNYLPSRFPTTLHPSTNFLESCGCILFDFRHTKIDPSSPPIPATTSRALPRTEPHILLIHSHTRNETLLPKGRRNISESRTAAALRETLEETGLLVSLLPITLHSRATSSNPSLDRTDKDGFTIDEMRTFHGVTDPFMVVLRQINLQSSSHGTGTSSDRMKTDASTDVQRGSTDGNGGVVKLIWWYVGVVDADQGTEEEIRIRREGIDPGCEVISVPMKEAVGRCTFKDDAEIVAAAIKVISETFGWDGDGNGDDNDDEVKDEHLDSGKDKK